MQKLVSICAAIVALATPSLATEINFTLPIKSGPLLGQIGTGTIDLEDGTFTGQGTEIFFDPDFPQSNPSTGDIVGFSFTVLTLTFTIRSICT